MLRIKPEFDLKELEKFGFEYDEYNEVWRKGEYYDEIEVTEKPYENIKARQITYFDNYGDDPLNIFETIYDLIRAGLVEKL